MRQHISSTEQDTWTESWSCCMILSALLTLAVAHFYDTALHSQDKYCFVQDGRADQRESNTIYNAGGNDWATAKPIAWISEPCGDHDGLRIKKVSQCAQPSKLPGPSSWNDLLYNPMEVNKKHVLRETHDILGVLISGASSLRALVNFCERGGNFEHV